MTAIPNRAVFRSQEVCEIAEVQPYVLRSWEAEFPDLGLSKSAGSPRVYRKGDVERVLRIKHLLLVEGLTLAGARRQLSEEDPALVPVENDDSENVTDSAVAELLDREVRKALNEVRTGLHGILGVLRGAPDNGAFRMVPESASARTSRSTQKKSSKPAPRGGKTVKSSGRSARPSRAARPAKKASKTRR